MPTITVSRSLLFSNLKKSYSLESFDQLLFDFGLELDDETEDELKIEVPNNRYDLLSLEGLSRALAMYEGVIDVKDVNYKVVEPKEKMWEVLVKKEVSQIRPFFLSAHLRGISFKSPQVYRSFIDLQDKLHQSVCRGRKLVAIGTHDSDKMSSGLVTYEALPPDDIKFVPLNKSQSYTATQLMKVYESEEHLKPYLPIIRSSPVYPVIYDSERNVMSMPPIINSEKTKITENTRNVFIDMTATDETRLGIAMDILVTAFSQYCDEPFTVEPVKVTYEESGKTFLSPTLSYRSFTVRPSTINSFVGVSVPTAEICSLLSRMGHASMPSSSEDDSLTVSVPPSRPDILHECDLIEDVAIAYGINNIPKTFPKVMAVGKPSNLEILSDKIGKEMAMRSWLEVKTLVLCSHDENFAWLNHKDDHTQAVIIENPKSIETQTARVSLIPGLLKSLRENRDRPLPNRIFEVGDILLKGSEEKIKQQSWVGTGTGVKNVRKVGGAYRGFGGGFEIVQGAMERVMHVLEVKRLSKEDRQKEEATGFWIEEGEDAMYFPGRAAKIMYRPPSPKTETSITEKIKTTLNLSSSRDIQIGSLGILHPTVLEKFDLVTPKPYPVAAVEWEVEWFL